jgi:DNA-binding transcriptional MerR regulator
MTKKIESMQKQAQALTLRKAGVSVQTIAETLGWNSHQAASKAISAALKRTLQEPADELRTLELARLDDMLKSIASNVQAGNLTAIDRALKIQDRRAKLMGLDMPAKVDLSNSDGTLNPYMNMDADKLIELAKKIIDARHTD